MLFALSVFPLYLLEHHTHLIRGHDDATAEMAAGVVEQPLFLRIGLEMSQYQLIHACLFSYFADLLRMAVASVMS